MRFNKRIGIVFAGLVLSGPSLVQAQQIRSATWSTDQFVLRYRTMVEPPRPSGHELHIGGGGADDSVTQHRILTDSQQKKYFGYDLQVQPLTGGRFQLTFKPLTLPKSEKELMHMGPEWSELPMPSVPATMQVNEGETVALDLLVNQATAEKIVEYISVNSSPKHKGTAVTSGPRDLQVNDIPISLVSPTLYINGKSWDWNRGDVNGSATGALAWFYVPDRGRFLLSFAPRANLGFRQAGEVRGSDIQFAWNGETYELQTGGNVGPPDGAWNLYVLQDAGYRPGGDSPALYGADNKPENLLRR